MVTSSRARLRLALSRFLHDEAGEIGPVTYLFAVIPALICLFFAYDVGISKGARLGVEYAAFCAARAAATQIPQNDKQGACASGDEMRAIRHAAAACLASVAKKDQVFGRLDMPGSLPALIRRTEGKTQVEIQDTGGRAKTCFGHNDVVQVEVSYQHDIALPLSPLAWSGSRPIEIKATAQAMLHTIK